jgi:metallo-beta-lactamase family protein
MIIISASGMAETGPILHHLRNNIEDDRNTIVIVSWQAPDTLGRRLAEQQRHIRIFGEEFYRRAEVVTIGGMSAHAGQNILKQYALSSTSTLKQIFLVHGEPEKSMVLKQVLDEAGSAPIAYPDWQDSVEI